MRLCVRLTRDRTYRKVEGYPPSALSGGAFICTTSKATELFFDVPCLFFALSWEALQKTSDVSDDELNARYQETALYSTLITTIQREDGPLIQPSEALMIPTNEEMASRWPGMSTDQIEALGRDYIAEQDRLGDLELDDVFTRIQELAAHAVEMDEDR